MFLSNIFIQPQKRTILQKYFNPNCAKQSTSHHTHKEQIACGLDRMMIPKHERDYISLYLMTLLIFV